MDYKTTFEEFNFLTGDNYKMLSFNSFPHWENSDYLSMTLFLKNSEDEVFLVYIPKIKSNVKITGETMIDWPMTGPPPSIIDYNFSFDVFKNNDIFFQIFNLSEKKKMTKKEIEKQLGYKVEIIDE